MELKKNERKKKRKKKTNVKNSLMHLEKAKRNRNERGQESN